MCSTGVLLARACAVLMCLAVVAQAPPAKVHAAGTTASLAHCPSYCGDVEISYPFGIGPGCFRQGFELTCDNTTGSPRLFLGNSTQVTSIDVGSNMAYASAIAYNITMGLGVDTYTQSWEAPTGVVIDSENNIYVVGCGVDIYMFGDNMTDPIGSCMSTCTDNREIMERVNMGYACEGFGCCIIWSLTAGRQAFTLKLVRRNSTIALLDEALSSIKVIFSEHYHFVVGDLYASWVNTSNVRGMVLDIAITDQPSCASAQSQEKKDTYACNSESICKDLPVSRGGYNCFCPGQMEGNPYVVDGCIGDYNPKAPNDNCTRLCGNITIPFPFGIEEGCFANHNLRLNCTSNTTILDRGYAQYRVTNLSLDDGLLTITNMLNDTSSNNMERVVITNYDGQYTTYYEEVVDNNFDFSQEDVVIKWAIANITCQKAMLNKATYACISDNSLCKEVMRGKTHDGYRCKCSNGFQGNPYLKNSCTDIDECKYPDQYVCYGVCKNTPGSYICQCNTGYTGNASIPNACTDIDECEHKEAYSCYGICQNFPGSFHCQCPEGTYGNPFTKGGCIAIKNSITGLSIGLGVGGGTGLLLLALGGPYIMRKMKLQKVKKMKQSLFKQNHGLLLQQLISHNTDISERMIITLSGIEKATNNFDRARIVGSGGHGVVFKGILDLQVVAVKKSKIVVQREIKEFINEVAVLSQVNHRNVVKLLGCCLETEVPLLVYEFISNGTLCHHLHIDGPISLPWDDRMRIATEVAKALSYLHSAASVPIFHRDIKSANILLDDALTAKVSDFGASRYIPTDQTGVTTAVQGTMGYLDPMYYYTGRLTDKSDVFSFGVLLVELLTRKKPYIYRSVDDDGLVSHFVSLVAEGKLVDIIDPQVMEEGGEIQEVATLAAMCTKIKGEDRPTMREVEMTLESLLMKKRQGQYNGTPMRSGGDEATPHYGGDEATPHYRVTGRDCNEASRQYTMEEEICLSANYPR